MELSCPKLKKLLYFRNELSEIEKKTTLKKSYNSGNETFLSQA